jgi:hypothetical protein
VHNPLLPTQRDERRLEPVTDEAPLAEADDRLDQVRRDGADGVFTVLGRLREAFGLDLAAFFTGSTTTVFEGPLSTPQA